MRLLLFGCSGFVGRELVPQLLACGHQLTIVSRKRIGDFPRPPKEGQLFFLQMDPSDPETWQRNSLLKALAEAEGVVNLTGEPIAERRWTPRHLKKIENSRLETTKELVEAMQRLRKPPRVLVNASAVGYYGTSRTAEFNEASPSGQDFLAQLCSRWETLAQGKPRSTRLLIVRFGIVLAPGGGALGKMLPVFKAGLGGPIGKGDQWMSWIHRTDLCRIIVEALENRTWLGVVNAVAPSPVLMTNFSSELGKVLGRPTVLPVPGPILKIFLGDGASVVLEGQRVVSKRLQQLGFSFKYPDLNDALSAATTITTDK